MKFSCVDQRKLKVCLFVFKSEKLLSGPTALKCLQGKKKKLKSCGKVNKVSKSEGWEVAPSGSLKILLTASPVLNILPTGYS